MKLGVCVRALRTVLEIGNSSSFLEFLLENARLEFCKTARKKFPARNCSNY